MKIFKKHMTFNILQNILADVIPDTCLGIYDLNIFVESKMARFL